MREDVIAIDTSDGLLRRGFGWLQPLSRRWHRSTLNPRHQRVFHDCILAATAVKPGVNSLLPVLNSVRVVQLPQVSVSGGQWQRQRQSLLIAGGPPEPLRPRLGHGTPERFSAMGLSSTLAQISH